MMVGICLFSILSLEVQATAEVNTQAAFCGLKLSLALKHPELDLETGMLKSELALGPELTSPFGPNQAWQLGAGYSDIMRYKSSGLANSYGSFDVHGGLDFRVPAGTYIYAVKRGLVKKVVHPPGVSDKHVAVHIQESDANGNFVGRTWQYAHIELASIPREFFVQDVPIQEGTYIGQVVKWWENQQFIPDQVDISDQQRYDHLHIYLSAGEDAYQKVFFNPTRFFIQQDLTAPHIEKIYYSIAGPKQLKTQMPSIQQGEKLSLFIDAFDKIGESPFKLGIKALKVSISSLGPESKVVYENAIAMENAIPTHQLGNQSIMPTVEQIKVDNQVIYPQWDRFRKQMIYEVTAKGKPIKAEAWDTSSQERGTYLISIEIMDEFGNSAKKISSIKVI